MNEQYQQPLSIELFVATSCGNAKPQLFVSVPHKCGLSGANAIKLVDKNMLAMKDQSILPIVFTELSPGVASRLHKLGVEGHKLVVGEFSAVGLLDAYFLDINVG